MNEYKRQWLLDIGKLLVVMTALITACWGLVEWV